MPKTKSGFLTPAFLMQVAVVVFAAGGGWMALKSQAATIEKQQIRIERNEETHAEFKEVLARLDERQRLTLEAVRDMQGRLAMYGLPE